MLPQHGTLELSRSRLNHNLALLREKIGPKPTLCATIKANAYGHGVTEIANMLHSAGIDWACVYSFDEAVALRHTSFNILALSPLVLTRSYDALPPIPHLVTSLRDRIRINITDLATAQRLSAAVLRMTPKSPDSAVDPINVHLQVDAGLTRIGVDPEEVQTIAREISWLPGLRLEGLFAHFSHGDVPRHGTLQQQLAILHAAAESLRKQFPHLIVHLQNSGGAFNTDTAGLDMVRIGIALYGLQPSTTDPIAGLLPIARVIAPILAIHERPAGTGVGYGHTFVTSRHSRLAVVPVGYADGYPRQLSNSKNAVVQVRGVTVPVVGRVSMDQIIIDVTDVPPARIGDSVTVVSNDPAHVNALDAMADTIGTIGYELATHLGPRLQRAIVD
jgi:alanine racemase